MSRFVRSILAALLCGASLAAAPANAADLQDAVVSDAGICSKPAVLHRITSKFNHQVRNVPKLPLVSIVDFRNIHEHRYIPSEGLDNPIGRRYCGATVALSDGRDREIWYLIEEGMGFASVGDNVEFCVAGFDRWNVYNGRCRVLR